MYLANRIRHRIKYALGSLVTLLVLFGGIGTLCPTAEAVQNVNMPYQNTQGPNVGTAAAPLIQGRQIVLPFTFVNGNHNRGVATLVMTSSPAPVADAEGHMSAPEDGHIGFRIAIEGNPHIVSASLVNVPGATRPVDLPANGNLQAVVGLPLGRPWADASSAAGATCTVIEGVVNDPYSVDMIVDEPHHFALQIRYKTQSSDRNSQPIENLPIVQIPAQYNNTAYSIAYGAGIPFNRFPVAQSAAPFDIARDLPFPTNPVQAAGNGAQPNQQLGQPGGGGLAPAPLRPGGLAPAPLRPGGPGAGGGAQAPLPQAFPPAVAGEIGGATPFNLAGAPPGIGGDHYVTQGMGRTQQYQQLGLPQATVFHPYHPAGYDPDGPPGGHDRINNGLVSTPFAARLSAAHFPNLPASVQAALANEGINQADVDIDVVQQNMPWSANTEIELRPHYWTDPAALNVGVYNTNRDLSVGLFHADRGLSIRGQAPGTMGQYHISVHQGPADQETGLTPIVSSPDNMQVDNLNHRNSTSIWSVVRNGPRAAVTLHLLLDDNDHQLFQDHMICFPDLNGAIQGLSVNTPHGRTWVAKLTGLIQGPGRGNVAAAEPAPGGQAVAAAAQAQAAAVTGIAPPSSANTQQLPAPARGWNQATIDNPQSTGGQTVVLQHRGTLLVANRANNGGIRIGRYNPANRTWQFQPIGSANCNARSLAGVVHNGAIHIFATGLQGNQSSISHLSSANGQDWQEEHLDVGHSSGLGLSVSLHQGQINIVNRGQETNQESGIFQIRHVTQGPQGWGTATIAHDASATSNTAIGEYGGQLHVLYETCLQEINHLWYDPLPANRWSDEILAARVAANTALNISTYGGQFHINYEGAGNQVIHRWYAPTTGQWGQETIAADLERGSNITTATYGNQYHLVYGSVGNRLAHRWFDAPTGRWYNETLDNGNVTAIAGLDMVEFNGSFHILATTPTDTLRHNYYQP